MIPETLDDAENVAQLLYVLVHKANVATEDSLADLALDALEKVLNMVKEDKIV